MHYAGTHGGETFRRILTRTGSGFAFFADSFAPVEAHLIKDTGALTLLIPIDNTAESRFWRELARFRGFVDEIGRGHGSWTCAPLDIEQNGYVDTTLSVTGTWEIEPISSAG